MTTTRTRISVLAWLFGAGIGVVMLHLAALMLRDHAVWARRSQENRWSFRSVPSQRGSLLDRFGRVLAYDEPKTELAVLYVRFRQWHVVGAAVHGATQLARLQPGGEGTTYGYLPGALGPMQAAHDLLAMPTRLLRPRVLSKAVASELGRAATTLLASTSGYSRSLVYGALRAAAQSNDDSVVGDVLDVPAARLMEAFQHSLDELTALEATLAAERQRLAQGAIDPPEPVPGLFETLESLRRASLGRQRVAWTVAGKVKYGSLIEEVARTFADQVPFELAAELRIGARRHPGIEVSPAVTRRSVRPASSSLAVLIGTVADLDRQDLQKDWFDGVRERLLPTDWLDDLVPEGVAELPQEQELLRAEAEGEYKRAMMLRERRGTRGFESWFDAELAGRLGMRFVERDSKSREHVLWSHLRVQPGDDVRVTIDVDLQQVAERAVVREWQKNRDLHADAADQAKVEAAVAVIDAASGDVLAYAGAPIVSPSVPDVPGVVWPGNGALGSVVKPFLLVEQLQSMVVGRPHCDLDSLEPCSKDFRFGGTVLHCSHAHWQAGRDPVHAIGDSCNFFFYQVGIGLGEAGVARALRRFGLQPPAAADDAFAACWQERVRGIGVSAPRHLEGIVLPNRAIGYGVAASPLAVARAYAAIATGALPTLGFAAGEPRPRVALDDVEAELEVVRRGMRECVETGTARRLPLLRELQVHAKTGTAEVGPQDQNNGWLAGYLPPAGEAGVQLVFCAVVYWVKDGVHGGDAAGQIATDLFADLQADPTLRARYLAPEGGR
ncbi:MAG: hypothetical protein JNN13_15410 [Planctomycetes bacterium]|nr:hypothetical protein [Planctomycetota bacterium]